MKHGAATKNQLLRKSVYNLQLLENQIELETENLADSAPATAPIGIFHTKVVVRT
jgi:hypothetical protein